MQPSALFQLVEHYGGAENGGGALEGEVRLSPYGEVEKARQGLARCVRGSGLLGLIALYRPQPRTLACLCHARLKSRERRSNQRWACKCTSLATRIHVFWIFATTTDDERANS